MHDRLADPAITHGAIPGAVVERVVTILRRGAVRTEQRTPPRPPTIVAEHRCAGLDEIDLGRAEIDETIAVAIRKRRQIRDGPVRSGALDGGREPGAVRSDREDQLAREPGGHRDHVREDPREAEISLNGVGSAHSRRVTSALVPMAAASGSVSLSIATRVARCRRKGRSFSSAGGSVTTYTISPGASSAARWPST